MAASPPPSAAAETLSSAGRSCSVCGVPQGTQALCSVSFPALAPVVCNAILGVGGGLDAGCLAILSTYARTKSFWLSCSLNLMKMTDNAALCVPAKKEDISPEVAPGGAEIDSARL